MLRRRKEVSRNDRIIKAAERGDIDGVLAVLKDNPTFANSDFPDAMEQLKTAIETIGNESPERLVQFSLTRILSFQTFLLVRMQHVCEREIAEDDRTHKSEGGLNNRAVELIEHLAHLHEQVRQTARCIATVAHTFTLAENGPIKTRVSSANVIHLAFERSRAAASE